MNTPQAELTQCLNETETFDFSNPDVQAFVAKANLRGTTTEQLIQWYTYVRDSFLYDPYHLDLRKEQLRASVVVKKKRAWCVEKALLFVAGCRFLGIPARMGFGIVQNHLGVDKLEQYLKRKEIVFHGFAEVWHNEKWVKCTPAFDKRICGLSKIEPLEWDAENDSLFQAFSASGQFMEYLHFYGSFPEIPFQLMHDEMKAYYPHLFSDPINTPAFSFHFDTYF